MSTQLEGDERELTSVELRILDELGTEAPMEVDDVAMLFECSEEMAQGELRNLQQDGLIRRVPEEGFYLSEQLDDQDQESDAGDDQDGVDVADEDELEEHDEVVGDETAYQTEAGTVYHLDHGCGLLANGTELGNGEKEIQEVLLEDAEASRRSPCSACADTDDPVEDLASELADVADVTVSFDGRDLPDEVLEAILEEVLEN